MPLHSTLLFKRSIVIPVLISLFATMLPLGPMVQAIEAERPRPGGGLEVIKDVGAVDTIYGLVAILVDEETWGSKTSGTGEFAYLGNTKISEKIETYAEDVQSALPWTKAMIITVSEDDTTPEIHKMLERLYFEGDPNEDDLTQLMGVVVIGEGVPLPVVNKNEYRFLSTLPYTDFEEPAYVLNEYSLDFVPNVEAQDLQTEVWHGLIVPPLSGQDGIDLLGQYFEKNHAYHDGDELYTTFDEKVFIGDFVTEEATINSVAFASYQRFLDIWEEIAFYQYSSSLLEELVLEMSESVDAGDGLDNDSDGKYDEEAQNGIDDDGDGLIDEDIGDGFHEIDNDEDGQVDEDGLWDNNNDAGWEITIPSIGADPEWFEDKKIDEDPPGDTTGGEDADGDGIPDGDGCPGLCGVDDSGYASDHDEDSYPTGFEIIFGSDWQDSRKPHQKAANKIPDLMYNFYGESLSFDDDEDALAWAADQFTDGFWKDYYLHPSCYADDGTKHPEWDDDEDGFCDEDGSTEMQLWADENATPASGNCAYNDGDCDGSVDEDPEGMEPEPQFENLPDIQSKPVIEALISRYTDMFAQPQGVWNRLVGQTGRYETQVLDEEENAVNDYDSPIALIAKKDEFTLQYLDKVNRELGSLLGDLVEDHLQEDIPLIAAMELYVELVDEDGDDIEGCEAEARNSNLERKSCVQFVNHANSKEWNGTSYKEMTNNSWDIDDFGIQGQPLWEIDRAYECTNAGGTYEDGGQLVDFNLLYSYDDTSDLEPWRDYAAVMNCLPDMYPYLEDIPYVCAGAIVDEPIKTNTGAKMPDDDVIADREEQWERGFPACFEFREISTYVDYRNAHGDFNKWLSKKVRKYRKKEDDTEANYSEFLEMVYDEIDSMKDPKPGEATLKKKYGELDMIQKEDDYTYTVYNMFQDLGLGDYSEDQMDVYLGLDDYISIDNPQYGSGMGDIDKVKVWVNKAFYDKHTVDDDTPTEFTNSESSAYSISSVYKHTQPWKSVLNDQIEAISVPNIPIDKTRRISFYDGSSSKEEVVLEYINVLDAEDIEDVQSMLQELADEVYLVKGGPSYADEVTEWMDVLNVYQLTDAIEWMNMNVDEKHKYVLESYIGLNEPIIGKSRNGYELVSIIADGTATELYGAFNGDKPEMEGDLEFQYRHQDAIDAALAASAAAGEQEFSDLGGLEGFQPVVLSEWLGEIQDWFEEVSDSVSSFAVYEGGTYCATPTATGNTTDSDGDGVPDDANETVSIEISSEDNNILQSGGVDYYIVSASARKADGSLNTDDSFTRVKLDILTGEGLQVEFSGSSEITLTGGLATFALRSGDESGEFMIEASPQNRDDLVDSNSLDGSVTSKSLNVFTYITDDILTDGETIKGELIEIEDEDGTVRAVFDPLTGDLELRDAEAELRETTSELPLRVAVTNGEGTTYGVIFLIPDDNTLAVGDGIQGVYLSIENDAADTEATDEGIYLIHNEQKVGLVTDRGQIAVDSDYYLNFSNAGEINLYEPIRVVSGGGITLFNLSVKHSFSELSDIYKVEDSYEDYLTMIQTWHRGLRGQVIATPASPWFHTAMAATGILDTDGDLLDDLEEWTIGTDRELEDTDLDTIDDGDEIFNGLNPNGPGALFTDLDPSHEAYDDVVTLYLRGVIKGFSDGSFRPDNPLSREEFVKVDLGAICIVCDNFSEAYEDELFNEYNKDAFPDDDINSDLLACVAEAKVRGIVSGYAGGEDEGSFVPRQPISRAEATKVLIETAGLPIDDLVDGDIWYTPYIVSAQLYSLFPEGRFDELDTTSSDFHDWAVSDAQFKDWIEGYISRSEFAIMAVNLINAQDCRDVDTDGDGLSDAEEEYIYGTDPNMEDTDLGGVSDFEEVVRGSDPLYAPDDLEDFSSVADADEEDFTEMIDFDHEPGVYGVSDTMDYEEIAVASGSGAAVINVFTSEQAADGESTLFVRAEVRDEYNFIYTDDDSSVVEFILTDTTYGDVTTDRVQVTDGIAETVFVTTRTAGELSIEARLTDGSLPSSDHIVKVYPGEPASLSITGESSVLPAGAESATDMLIEFYDTFGNVANNGFYLVSIEADADMEILDLYDEDSSVDGIQLTTSDGYLRFRVLASPDAVLGTITATLPEVLDSGDSFSIEHIENLYLEVESTEAYMFAGNGGAQEINIRAVDHLGQTLTGFNGDVSLSISDPSFGSFTADEVTLASGVAVGEFNVAETAGTALVLTDSAGLEGGSENIEVKPDSTYELRVRTENGASILNAGERNTFIIDAYDIYGNLATTDSSSTGTIRFTTATEDFGNLSTTSFTLNQGSAEFDMTPEQISGIVNMVVSSGDLLAGTWGGEIKYSISGEEISEIEPQMLYASVLGAAFGDVTKENYIGGWLTFNGKTQAITSLLSEPVPKSRVAGVDAEGNIMLPANSLVTLNALGASTDLPMRFQWRSYPDDKLIGEVLYVFPNSTEIIPTALSSNPSIVLEESNGEWLLRDDSTVAAKVREDGQIVLKDSNYNIAVSQDSEGLALVVSKATEQVLLVEYSVDWTKDVKALDSDVDISSWSSYSSGIYIKPTPDVENLMVNIPTGNNSLSPMGLAIIDPEIDLATNMQPSMGYTSLESAELDGTIGWENDNKHLLLYAAGNTVGESNLFYASEVGTVLGDPTIKLTTEGEINELGFTSDIGTMIYADQSNILEMMPLDYNDDGQEDVILAYANGNIEVLQNVNGARRLQSKGTLLKVENGINAIDKGDFNGDGMDDLIVVTEESCFADEMCLYIYENIGGGFVAENLTIDDIDAKPVQLKVVDLNNDDYSDLVIVDENMVTYVAWNVDGEIKAVDKLRDFGLYADSTENLYADVLVRYDDLEYGSSVLPMATTTTVSPSIDTDIQDFVDNLGLNGDITLQIDGIDAEGQEVTRMENFEFEYADSSQISNDIYVSKNVEDSNDNTVEIGDTIEVSLFIKNQSGTDYSDIYVSDMVTGMYSYDKDSLACTNCDETNGNPSILPGMSSRPWIYGPISLASGERIQLEYTMEARALPSVEVIVGQDIQTDYLDDDFADIAISLEGNNTGQLMLYYSDGYVTETELGDGFLGLGGTSYERVIYTEKEYSPDTHADEYETEDLSDDTVLEDADENGIPDLVELMNTDVGIPVPPPGAYDPAAEVLGAKDVNENGFYTMDELYASDEDADNDGWNDTIDNWVVDANLLLDPELQLDAWAARSTNIEDGVSIEADGGTSDSGVDLDVAISADADTLLSIEGELSLFDDEVEVIAQAVEKVVSTFTCSGGCLALPGSVAFLAPGWFHDPLFGLPIMIDTGTPIFGITGMVPPAPPVCFGQSCYVSFTMRTYLAPTTTLGLGLGICVGTYPVGKCYAFNLPILQALGVCDAVNGFIADGLSKATDFVDGVNKAFNSDAQAQLYGDNDPTGLGSDIFSEYEAPIATNVNIQVPGFPAIFTEWWKGQKLEFFKMLDLPDVTFIYPDPASIASEFTGIKEKANDNAGNSKVDLDSSSVVDGKINELTSGGVFDLEQWLNYAHALPLIDIKPEPVTIYYPWLVEEEIEAFKKEASDWAQDARDELNRFLGLFCLVIDGEKGNRSLVKKDNCIADALDPAEEAVLLSLVSVIDDTIGAVEANLAVIESYGDIPRQILEIRTLQAYYAKTIVCYLDVILSKTAGYLSENVQRIEAWMQWFVDMTTIIEGWKLLLDLSVDFMDACDKCTNQRYSGLQLLFSLFVFIPDFPVIELPKLPDIVIDVSHIQAGVDVVWPDIDFKPATIELPELPRIVLPRADLNLDFDLDIDIPVLPEFNLDFTLPPLPGLVLPDLPSVPPPPSVPEIFPEIQVALNIASNILKIICLIRSGFIPTDEMLLKSKIEDITERPGGIILPFDLRLNFEWPGFRKEFLERIEINTYLNLTMDFSLLYDYVDDIGKRSNDFITGEVDHVNDALVDVMDAIEAVITPIGEIEISIDAEVDASADLGSGDYEAGAEGEVEGSAGGGEDDLSYLYDHPAFDTAQQYINDPLVKNNLLALESSMIHLQAGIDDWAATLPEDDYVMVATQRILAADDPLLHQYDDIILDHKELDANFLASIEGSPLASVAIMRNSMIAYIDDLEQGTQILEGLDDTGFQRYLAQESEISPHFLLASSEDDGSVSTAEMWTPELMLGDDPLEVQLSSDIDPDAGLDSLEYGTEPYVVNDGIYIFNEEEGVATKLVTYSQESDEGVDILFIDVDNDGDEDVIYSLGGDVYLKENHTESPTRKYMTSDPSSYDVDELTPEHGSIKNLRTAKNDNEEASFSMNSSYSATAYEVMFYDSMDAMQGSPEDNLKRMLLLAKEQNSSAVLLDENGEEKSQGSPLYAADEDAVFKDEDEEITIEVEVGSEFNLPEMRESRLLVENVTGSATLTNAYHRETISSNGEIETAQDVVLQTLEDTTIVIEKDEKTMTLEIPEYTWIDLRRDPDRVVRIDSGEVLWIDLQDIDEEQDIIEGMELFVGEGITVDGIIANTTLETSDGVTITLDKNEIFEVHDLISVGSPTAKVAIENGAYYTRTRGIYSDGTVGTLSDNILLNPQICGDTSSPYPIVDTGNGVTEVAIFKTKELSAESSFDSGSEIASAEWDLDLSVDSDGDGDTENDVDATGLVADIGPYDNLDPRQVLLTIADTAGNEASTTVDVEVYVPDITISEALTTQITGTTDPATETFPFYLVREREGVVNEIGSGQYLTDDFGDFIVDDLNENELVNVVDDVGGVIAQFNPETHQVMTTVSGYEISVVEAGNGWPAHLAVYDESTGIVMGSFAIIADEARSIVVSEEPLADMNLRVQDSVTVYFEDNSESGYEITDSLITSRDSNASMDLMIEADGNINIFDTSRYDLVRREADSLDEYLIIELYDYGTLEMEIWVGSLNAVNIQTTDELGLAASELLGDDGDLSADTRIRFEDISEDDPLYEDIYELVERGVIEGTENNGLYYFFPDEDINRAEFTKIVLSILCIVPRDEAYLEPSVFNDILSVVDWFYPFTKEAYLSDLITGYVGETDENGQTPFKPNDTITRAEAAKIMIEALISEGVLEDIEESGVIEDLAEDGVYTLTTEGEPEPWYAPYIEISQDLTPYMTDDSTLGEDLFIITAEEAEDPLHVITRYEFVEMSVRVLQAYNCFDLDSDGDGLINYDEENIYGTDPYNPDSDAGGVEDGDEVVRGSDPTDGEDDFEDGVDSDIFLPGIYAVREPCYTCPCLGNIDWDADLRDGDNVFAIIRNDEGTIFGTSNKVLINDE
jgi:hypothetical protein